MAKGFGSRGMGGMGGGPATGNRPEGQGGPA